MANIKRMTDRQFAVYFASQLAKAVERLRKLEAMKEGRLPYTKVWCPTHKVKAHVREYRVRGHWKVVPRRAK